MIQRRHLTGLLWLVPLLVHSAEALAWGLGTHVYFAQLLIWAVPLADPALWRAARRFPGLVMAGACLPDLLIVAGDPFRGSHRWETALRLLDDAEGEPEQAIAVGYLSHLLTDVVAHNHFVPAHEALWINRPMVTHALAEWAMDGYLQRRTVDRPGRLLAAGLPELSRFVAKGFGCPEAGAARAIQRLARAETLLRRSRLPNLLYGLFARADRRVTAHFDFYLEQTAIYLAAGIDALAAGRPPPWSADPAWQGELLALVQKLCRSHLRERISFSSLFLHVRPQEVVALMESA